MGVTSSNNYTWNDEFTLERIIDGRGRTEVVFINGIRTTKEDFRSNIISFRSELNLTNRVDLVGGIYQNSFTNQEGDRNFVKKKKKVKFVVNGL